MKHIETLIPELKESLEYDPETGELTWKISRSRNIKVGQLAGSRGPSGWRVKFKGINYSAHRLIWAMVYGVEPPPMIDHKDKNPFNNALNNLRASCKYTNQQNTKAHSDALSSSKGVHKHKNQWVVRISSLGVREYLGRFNTEEEATQRYLQRAKELHGEFSGV